MTTPTPNQARAVHAAVAHRHPADTLPLPTLLDLLGIDEADLERWVEADRFPIHGLQLHAAPWDTSEFRWFPGTLADWAARVLHTAPTYLTPV